MRSSCLRWTRWAHTRCVIFELTSYSNTDNAIQHLKRKTRSRAEKEQQRHVVSTQFHNCLRKWDYRLICSTVSSLSPPWWSAEPGLIICSTDAPEPAASCLWRQDGGACDAWINRPCVWVLFVGFWQFAQTSRWPSSGVAACCWNAAQTVQHAACGICLLRKHLIKMNGCPDIYTIYSRRLDECHSSDLFEPFFIIFCVMLVSIYVDKLTPLLWLSVGGVMFFLY